MYLQAQIKTKCISIHFCSTQYTTEQDHPSGWWHLAAHGKTLENNGNLKEYEYEVDVSREHEQDHQETT